MMQPAETGRTPDNNLQAPDRREGHPYRGRTGVFYGGSGGTGLTAAIDFQRLGGAVVLGASSESTFRRALVNVRFAKRDPSSIRPLIGDISDTKQLQNNIQTLEQEGLPVTDIFTFAASGMPFAMELDHDYLDPMNKIVAEAPPDKKEEQLAAKKEELKRQYAIWLPASRPQAVVVNYQAKINIIQAFLEAYGGKQPLTFLDCNSVFGKEGKGPGFYDNVLTKYEFSVWLGEHAEELAAEGMDTGEITAPVIEDTDVGKYLLTKVNPLLPQELAAVIVRTRVRKIHVFEAMREFLDMTREERAREGRPYERYVVGDNGLITIVKSIPEELRIDASKFDI